MRGVGKLRLRACFFDCPKKGEAVDPAPYFALAERDGVEVHRSRDWPTPEEALAELVGWCERQGIAYTLDPRKPRRPAAEIHMGTGRVRSARQQPLRG